MLPIVTMIGRSAMAAARNVGVVVAVFGAASRVAAAVRSRRMPAPRDLNVIGIDPKAFANLGR